jgi:diadenosine tetraphosphatase ApaH/serine/threonine PP2A family protein phosphatase
MIIALLADIHANQEALTACLADATRRSVERYIFLGDLVGYGADPEWVVDRVTEFTARGALAVLGNHDSAALGTPESLNETAQEAIEWTRPRLNVAQRDFLKGLPMTVTHGGRLFLHASAYEPPQWHYIGTAHDARQSLGATTAEQTFCGHLHLSMIYHLSLTGKLIEFEPVSSTPIPLLRGRKWLSVIGAVGQPRDHNPAACYALLDDVRNTLTYIRVPYDVETAARKVREAGLPAILAARLERGY